MGRDIVAKNHKIRANDSGEELVRVQSFVSVTPGNRARNPLALSSLYITTKQLVWLSDVDRAMGYTVDFFSLSLHAISTDLDSYPLPVFILRLKLKMMKIIKSEDSDSNCNKVLNLSKVTKMRIIGKGAGDNRIGRLL
ncbi:Nucleotide-sensitive chloride conductance regulator [Corchorus olitorius]|uniref:Nucleotide-sensitive chloride conductance regulator n=1 Tax=Corchorus olitorius TaxID=93759 RepID=A0A1R3HFL9_9ROSI|nr:Nucleotide-sensitive chloride conductance regulator [Corchorus olitorius]